VLSHGQSVKHLTTRSPTITTANDATKILALFSVLLSNMAVWCAVLNSALAGHITLKG
jgi:hypothetical protein